MAEYANASFKTPDPLKMTGNLAENFKKFKSRFDVYMVATGYKTIEDRIKVAVLLNIIGDEVHEVFETFDLNDSERENYDLVVNKIENYCIPRKNIIYERFLFYSRDRAEGEPFDHFLTEIRKLLKSCDFENPDANIRDRIVIGINDGPLQEKLIRTPDLTLPKTIEYCKAAEISREQAKKLQADQRVNVIKSDRTRQDQRKNTKDNNTDRKGKANRDYYCRKCGNSHAPKSCPAFGKTCNTCNKNNHFSIGCFWNKDGRDKKPLRRETRTSHKQADSVSTYSDDEDSEDSFSIHAIKSNEKTEPVWMEELVINNKKLKFKLDTGADINIMPWYKLRDLKLIESKSQIRPNKVRILTYGGSVINNMGSIDLICKVKNKIERTINFVIIDTQDVPILGREACKKLKLVKRLDLLRIKPTNKQDFIKINNDIFQGLGCYPIKQKIVIDNNAKPVIRPAYRVAESLKQRLKITLDKYIEKGIIKKVNKPSDWIHNLVIVEKPNGSLRLCIDPKEINRVIKKEHFQIPTLEEIIPTLANKQLFTVLDMSDGFFQLELDEASSRLCTVHTPFGRYRFTRMPFGLNSAPEIFQKITSQLFGDIDGVTVYFDDLIIATNTSDEHDKVLQNVINKAREYNIRFNKSKMQYKEKAVKYMGQIFSSKGMKPDEEDVDAILKLENPKNKKQLQSILGMVNYFGKYIPQLSKISAPLRELLKKDIEWIWTSAHDEAINEIKNRIAAAPTLKCYKYDSNLTIQTDASRDGLGCCLLMDGHPISFASRSLNPVEKNYAQIEKELLSIYFACRKFHSYIYGKKNPGKHRPQATRINPNQRNRKNLTETTTNVFKPAKI